MNQEERDEIIRNSLRAISLGPEEVERERRAEEVRQAQEVVATERYNELKSEVLARDRVQIAKREAALAKIQREAAAAMEFDSISELLDEVGDERLRDAGAQLGRLFSSPTAQIRASCKHLVSSTTTTINNLEGEDGIHNGWFADIRITCAWCGQPFQWIGPVGISPDQPMVSADRFELRAPMRPGND